MSMSLTKKLPAESGGPDPARFAELGSAELIAPLAWASPWAFWQSCPPSKRTEGSLAEDGLYGTHEMLTVPVECVHPLERSPATLTLIGSVIEVKLFVAFAVMSPSEPLPTPRPLALERLLFVM